MWKEDELWVKRKEWDNAKHLLDRTVVRVGCHLQGEFRTLFLVETEHRVKAWELENEWQEVTVKIQAEAQASANRNRPRVVV